MDEENSEDAGKLGTFEKQMAAACTIETAPRRDPPDRDVAVPTIKPSHHKFLADGPGYLKKGNHNSAPYPIDAVEIELFDGSMVNTST